MAGSNTNETFVTDSLGYTHYGGGSKMTEVDVRDYGAKGDGITDDTSAIQSAIDDAAKNGGGIVFFERKTYRAQFTIKQGVSINGNFCTFKPTAAGGSVIRFAQYVSHCYYKYFSIIGDQTYADATQHGIYIPRKANALSTDLSGINDCTFEHIVIRYMGGNGMYLEGGNYYSVIQFNTFRTMLMQDNGIHGIYTAGQIQSNLFQRVWMRGNGLSLAAGSGNGLRNDAYLENPTFFTMNHNTFISCNFEENKREGLYTRGNNNLYLKCWFEGNGRDNDLIDYSCGVYVNAIFTYSAERFDTCNFAQQNKDIWLFKGNEVQIGDGNKFAWSGIPATKASVISIETNSHKNYIGRHFYDIDTTAVPNFIVSVGTYKINRLNPPGKATVALSAGFVDITLETAEITTPAVNLTAAWKAGSVWVSNVTRTAFRINVEIAPTNTEVTAGTNIVHYNVV